MIDHTSATRPNGLYGASKVWGEALARHFTDTSDLSILCLRLGHVTKDDRPGSARDQSVWLSHADVSKMIELCVNAPDDLKFDVFYVVSNNPGNYRDLTHAQEVLGFEPQDSASDHA
ncbi:MAG: NAD(P)-dependent oxidoreductase [Caldilineaceae bacterium]|nr:NAD(P)-dependent oxidoreductase [Caldilineaceae bacterium]